MIIWLLMFLALTDLIVAMTLHYFGQYNTFITHRNDEQSYKNKTQVVINYPLQSSG